MTDLKTRLAALEHKHARDVRRLEEELNGMESLVEAKILREDELESQLNDAKRALAELQMVAHGTSARNGRKGRERGETVRANDSVSVRSRHSKSSMHSQDGLEDDDGKCEICHEQHETQVSRRPFFLEASIANSGMPRIVLYLLDHPSHLCLSNRFLRRSLIRTADRTAMTVTPSGMIWRES